MPRQRDSRRESRRQGHAYTTAKGKNISAKQSPTVDVPCKCNKDCKTISHTHRNDLFTAFRKMSTESQKAYVNNLIDIIPVQRRYSSTEKRQISASYRIPNGEGGHSVICKKTFMETFGLSEKAVRTILERKKKGNDSVQEARGGSRGIRFTAEQREQVKSHIMSFPREESHYGREDSSKEFLSADLNKISLFRAFQEKYPESPVSFDSYKRVLTEDFPRLKFGQLRVDTCKVCDRLNAQLKGTTDKLLQETTKATLLDHHAKANMARSRMTIDIDTATDDSICLITDLQQVIPMPTLTHSDMFYLRQLSHYNFGIHVYPSNDAFMCLWNEAEGGRGATDIASCIFNLINTIPTFNGRKKLIVWSDNCCGQNKNKYVLFMYMYMVHIGLVESVEHKFVASGHSYLQCDRDFGLIEKKRKKKVLCGRSDLEEVITGARQVPFKVIKMEKFLDFKNGADNLLNTTKLALSSAVWVKIDSPGIVKLKRAFDNSEFEEFGVLKRAKTIADFDKLILTEVLPKPLTNEKKKDLRQMLEFLPSQHRAYYEQYL